jgi:hypothetical protein
MNTLIQKAPVEFMTGLRMFGLKSAKTRTQGSVETAAAAKGKINSIIKSSWVATHRFMIAAVSTEPKALRQLPGFKPNIRNPFYRFT